MLLLQVRSLATSCPNDLQKGNVLAWADFLPGVVGRVKVDHKSKFCSGTYVEIFSYLCLSIQGLLSFIMLPFIYHADCPSLEAFSPHLRTLTSDLKPGSSISLFCDAGYQIVGSAEQRCLNLGEWDQPRPRCESQYPIPQSGGI